MLKNQSHIIILELGVFKVSGSEVYSKIKSEKLRLKVLSYTSV